jgi:hypothetical protein
VSTSPLHHTALIALAMAGLWGCAAGDEALYLIADSGDGAELSPDDFQSERLRIDVLPTVEAGDDLLAQSFWLDEQDGWQGLSLSLRPTITITGGVTGFAANPYGIQVPGVSDVPVPSIVTLQQPGTIIASTVQSDESGVFSFSLPAGDDYRLSVVPEALDLPMYIEDSLELPRSADLGEISLGYGDPIYGTVRNSDDEAIDCMVRLIDAETGIEGIATQTDASGFFMLRAEPGDYIVQIEPTTGSTLPTIQQPVSFEEGTGGAHLSVDVGLIEPVLVRGVPRASDGGTMSNAIVRLTARSLDDAAGTMVVETETDQGGGFLVYALPGEWTLEIIPPADADEDTAPYEATVTVGAEGLNLGSFTLSAQIWLERAVRDPDGEPAAGVLVTLVEQGFNRATYTAYTDDDGILGISVPDVPLDVWLTPTRQEAAVTRRELISPGTDEDEPWSLSEGVRLSGSVSRPGGDGGISIVEVYDDSGIFYGSTLTDGEGGFDFRISP